MNRKRILFLLSYFPFLQGGAEYQAFLLAQYLKNRGWDVSFVFQDILGNGKIITDRGFTLYPVKPYSPKGLSGSRVLETKQIFNILKKSSPEIIYLRGVTVYCLAACLYAKNRECRTVMHIAHDRDLIPFQRDNPIFGPFGFIDKKIMEYGLKNSHCIIAQTRYQADLLKKNYKRRCDCVIGNWHPVPNDLMEKDNSVIKVLWIANCRPFKRPELFIRLVNKINNIPGSHFMMIGRINQYHEIMYRAIENKIEVTGEIPISEVNKILSQSHLLINTSEMEGFSNTFIQAWMRKVPVISLNVDPDNILRQKHLGFCSGNFTQLVKDTRLLIKNHLLREKMGSNARQYAVENHSLDNIDKIVDILLS